MLSSKKKLLLLIIGFVFIFQALVFLQRREVHPSGEEFISNNISRWYRDGLQSKSEGGRISTFLKGKDEINWIELSENNEQNFNSFKDSNRVKVQMKGYKDIEKSDANIFFIESRCGTRKSSLTFGLNSTFNLKPRQCCSVESAAIINPTRSVYILHTCPLGSDFDLHLPTYARHMLGLSNVFVVQLSMAEALEGTPVTSLYRSDQLENSLYPIVHASDILRLAVLWRLGGTYCDMDILFIRSLNELPSPSNFCGLESQKAAGNSILNIEPTGQGHDILTKMLVQVNAHFDGMAWAANGPELVTDTLLHECNATIETLWQCSVFTVYNQTVFYPLLWKNHMDVFNADTGSDVVRALKDTGGFTVHLWNKFTAEHNVDVGSSQAYGLLADEFCPAVYRNCGHKF